MVQSGCNVQLFGSLCSSPEAATGGVLKKDVLKNFAKFKGKKRLQYRCFPVEFA